MATIIDPHAKGNYQSKPSSSNNCSELITCDYMCRISFDST
uniref:Uncharacterized protein n=1 Tax=Anguilla anguilla TaxID=7936 RepID=A0A0E9SGJ7_ANGAN